MLRADADDARIDALQRASSAWARNGDSALPPSKVARCLDGTVTRETCSRSGGSREAARQASQ
jgi:hypothetical protein